MTPKVIHFGADDCHRLMVLQSAGYAVEDCGSLMQLRASLAGGRKADALLMNDGDGVSPREALEVARANSSVPVILFRNTNLAYEETGFDLVVNCLTPPEIWLNDIDVLIGRCRAGVGLQP